MSTSQATAFPTPQFIPMKTRVGKECFVVNSWRDSPSVKPQTPAAASSPSPAAPPTDSSKPSEGKQHSRRSSTKGRASGTNTSSTAPVDEFDHVILRLVLNPASASPNGTSAPATHNGSGTTPGKTSPTPSCGAQDVEQHLAALDLKPLRCFDVGPPRAVPLKRLEGVESRSGDSGSAMSPIASATDDSGLELDDAKEQGAPPPLSLPLSVPATQLDAGHLICLVYADADSAQRATSAISKRWSTAVTDTVPRRRAALNATLVIKGLPFTTQCDKLVEELDHLSFKPSYVRLHRGERGVFKCVVFVKYPSRVVAEHAKLELERLIVGSRPLKVEFKKKSPPSDVHLISSSSSGGKLHSHNGGNVLHQHLAAMEAAVRELRASRENEGFQYQRNQLTKDDIKSLKHLAAAYDLMFEHTNDTVAIKRRLPGGDKPSPALRPSSAIIATNGNTPAPAAAAAGATSSTPQWAPATPGSLVPMDFRGIRHWKEMRQASTASLGIIRPIGPGDVAPFSVGRGRVAAL